jgi:hydroxymethylpyrimidine/phosphomethylpyrimidine kinase
MKVKYVLSIAGSDSSAGAGIQSDLKTFRNHGLYGLTVVTAITSQNTLGVQSSYELPPKVIQSQLESLFRDFDIKVVKTGMLASQRVIQTVTAFLHNKKVRIIVDPVIKSKNSFQLLNGKGVRGLANSLLPLSYLCTPNFFEAEKISGIKINDIQALEQAAKVIHKHGCKNALIKGGHFPAGFGLSRGSDVLYDGSRFSIFKTRFINTNHTHGIGCTFSAAITANLALGKSLKDAIISAKKYVSNALKVGKKIGSGFSPIEQ